MATTLLDRCRIQDRALVTDTTGGKKETFTERPKTLNCRWVGLTENDPAIELDSVFGRAEMILELPLGTDIKEGDRIRNLADSVLWQATGNLTPPSNLAVVMRIPVHAVGEA